MPTDSIVKATKTKGVRMIRRHRSHTDEGRPVGGMSRYRDDIDTDGLMPAPARDRLYDLFGQIEKEFENLYAANIALQERVESLNERLEAYASSDKPAAEVQETDGSTKPKRSASQISQKIKTTYKASTSKIVSSFRAPSAAYNLVRVYRGHRDGVWEVSVSKSGHQVIGTASADHRARDILCGRLVSACSSMSVTRVGQLHPLPSQSGPAEIAASQISQKIKTTYKASTSKIVSSFRAPSAAYNLVRVYRGHRDGVWEVSVSKSGHQVIGTASADHRARIFSVETGQCLLQYAGHQGSVNSIRFHPSQDLVLTASGDETAHIWRAVVTPPTHAEIVKSHSSGEDEIDGSEKEDVGDDGGDQVQESNKLRTPQVELTGHTDVVIAATGGSVDWMVGGAQVISASWDRLAILYDAETGEQISTLSGRGHQQGQIHLGQVGVVSRDRDTPGLAVSQAQNIIAIPHDNRHIRLFDISGVRVGRLPRSNRQGHSRMVCSVTFADDNQTCNLFSCGFDRQVLGWHINCQTKE
ncbi:LOW QUALITY PROTEIN: WD repeat-containing protein 37-like [Haliotis rubra]|uniref:LOW QUALITY PROTEIN: WD repeat-containing protein 37-like n=1 Tax=Haliotis rubra TaxID=36100 RepID=UPI001EE57CCF|nr:LOW QUALITY PROTEIN: WD repeat-containing protein 37-like [Haliotis rubra]